MHHLLPEKMFQAFFAVMAVIFIAYMLKAFFQYKVTVIGHGMGTLVEADMRQDIFTHMQELSFSFFDTHRTGVLMTRIANDLFEIVELAHHGPENILTCVITIAGALIVLFMLLAQRRKNASRRTMLHTCLALLLLLGAAFALLLKIW